MNNPYEILKEYEGQTIKYKDFCKIIKEPRLKDSAKTQQIKRLRNYIDLDTNYGEIVINKIYNEQEMLLIKRQSKFTEYIEDLLIMYIANNQDCNITLTYKEMAEYFCMVNEQYYPVKYNKYQHINEYNLKTNIMYFNKEDMESMISRDMSLFFNITDKLIKEIIKNALKSLKQKSLILYQDTFKLYRKTYIKETDSYIMETFVCDKEERETFLDLRKSVMERHNINKLQDIIYLGYNEREEYFKDLKITMMECDELHNCDMYANAFIIEYGKKGIEYEYKRLMAQNTNLLNNNMQFKLLTTKELDCINGILKSQFVENLIDK